jgi:hypothetical protein
MRYCGGSLVETSCSYLVSFLRQFVIVLKTEFRIVTMAIICAV